MRPAGLVRTIGLLSFRDDHDAAISRIAALEHELAAAHEDAREKSQRDRDRIAMLEREIDELRRKEPTAPRRAHPPSTPPTKLSVSTAAEPIDELATQGPAVSGPLVVLMLAVVLGTIALVYFMVLR